MRRAGMGDGFFREILGVRIGVMRGRRRGSEQERGRAESRACWWAENEE